MEQQYILREMHNKPITVMGYNPARRELLVGFEGLFNYMNQNIMYNHNNI